MTENFNPKPWARNPHLQSIFASSGIRTTGSNPMVGCAEEVIVNGGNNVRLLGYHSSHPGKSGKGLALLIHGWKGSSDSAYILHTGRYLFNKGYDIFRLNLRDHGKSHHLNEGLFHGGLIDETFTSAQNIAHLLDDKPFFIVGFSLGGNFALRIALRKEVSESRNLRHVISISPALDPYKATIAIDNGFPLYRYYFLRKWLRSLKIKQKLFPRVYEFNDIFKMKTLMEITDYIIPRHSPFRDHKEYFNTYTLSGNIFADLSIPVTIITAEDDPVVPVNDFHRLQDHDKLHLLIQRYGGHCGFIDPFPSGCWYERKIYNILKEY
jgi:hypothetical protein